MNFSDNFEKINILGVEIANISREEAVEIILKRIDEKKNMGSGR